MAKKRSTQKSIEEMISVRVKNSEWRVHYGRLKGSGKGDVAHDNLFTVLAEKIPFEFLKTVSFSYGSSS